MPTLKALAPRELYRHCDASQFPFRTTADLDATTDIVGQERAVDAIRFGIDIRRPATTCSSSATRAADAIP